MIIVRNQMEYLSKQNMAVFWIFVCLWDSLIMINNSEAHPSVTSKSLKTIQIQPRLQSNGDQYIRDKHYSPYYSYYEEKEPLSGR